MSTKAIKAKSGPTLPHPANNRGDATAVGKGLEAAIRCEHEAATSAAQTALDHALECGRLLAKAREGIVHGEWESFVRERCGIPERTARMYLRLDANRDRLPNRQHVAGLTVREAVRLLAEPKVAAEPEAVPVAVTEFDYLGRSFCSLTSTGCEFNADWAVVPFPLYEKVVADAWGITAPAPPLWYVAEHRHVGHHPTGWCFELTPDQGMERRVNALVHDAVGTLHLATFDGMNPAGILPFLTACHRHHGMPAMGDEWTVTVVPMPTAITRLAEPFQAGIFRLAMRSSHRCCCWMSVDEVIGLEPLNDNRWWWRAWEKFGFVIGKLFGPNKPCGDFDGASMWWLGDFLNHRATARKAVKAVPVRSGLATSRCPT